jgi:leader peptidase (prepilin peptidase) / N-methyltransferase
MILGWLSGATLLLLLQLLLISWIDFARLIIPDSLNLLLTITGLFVSTLLLTIPIQNTLIQSSIAYGFLWGLAVMYSRLRGKQGLGGGDIKFITAATCWVGLLGLPWTVLIASLSGLTFVLIAHLFGHSVDGSRKLPFGPHLSLGLFITWLLQSELSNILNWG